MKNQPSPDSTQVGKDRFGPVPSSRAAFGGCHDRKSADSAGLPPDWRIGAKTGTSNHDLTNDIAIAWPPDRVPLLIAAYHAESAISQDRRDAVLAEVGRVAGDLAS